MSKICDCNVGLSNVGTPTCQPIASVARKLIVVPFFKADGSVNSIDVVADALDDAFFTAKINETAPADRWFPFPLMKNVLDERAESTFEEFDDGAKFFIKDGIRTFTAMLPVQSPAFLDKIISIRCTKIGVFVIDANNNIIGSQTVAGKLFPIKIEEQTWTPILVKATDAGVQKISLSFDFAVEENDEDIRMITGANITANMLALNGLLDGILSVASITATTFKATINTCFGDLKDLVKVQGLLLANFTLTEVSPTPGPVTITSVTESAPGVYDFLFASQTSADVLKLTAVKTGFDFSTFGDVVITIP